MLANRLNKVMKNIIYETQTAFVDGRWILEAALVANEALDTILRRRELEIMFTLDIEKHMTM